MDNLHITYLADQPEALPALQNMFQTEWASYYGAGGPGNAKQDLLAFSSREKLPIGFVAFVGSQPCGIIALKPESITTHSHLGPWVGAGIVLPKYRRHGIGAQLLLAVEAAALSLGFKTIYSGTSTANSLLVRGGWQFMELVRYNGEPVSIYEKAL
jgi:GNAT superfamily N-acetyltransferase